MRYEIIRLREVYPALAQKPLEELAGERRKHCEQNGNSGYGWARYREPTLTAYLPDNFEEIDLNRRRPSLVICPGGGYESVSSREAEPVALAFLPRGYNVFVLDYEVAPVRYPQALLTLSGAVSLIRNRAQEWNADPGRIAVCGFSAGGHLAGSLGVFWNEPFLCGTLGVPDGSNRPNGLVLCYPVISSGSMRHEGSFQALLGQNPAPALFEKMSLEKQVGLHVPPTFLWHTFEDDCVPVENSLLFAQGLRKSGVPFELHIYPKGGHGMSLCSREVYRDGSAANPHCATWVELCGQWLDLILA